ncbi:MAG: hypothetical protein AB1918_00935 [Pseudomonadota bacterium]
MTATLDTEGNLFAHLWEERAALVAGFIAQGERSLARVLGRLSDFERRHRLVLQREDGRLTGAASWIPQPPDPANRAFYPDGPATPEGTPLYAWAGLAGTLTIRPFHASYDHLIVPLARDLMRQRQFDAVVELGSGFGDKLFRLYLAGAPRTIPYFGAELWDSGRRLADRLAKLEPDMDFRGVTLDLLDPDLSILAPFKNVLLLSNGAFYCVPSLPRTTFQTLAGCAENVTGVHFEPVGHQVAKDKPYLAGYYATTITQRDFNQNMIPLLLAAERQRVLKVEFLAPDLSMISSGHPVSVAVWHSLGGAR